MSKISTKISIEQEKNLFSDISGFLNLEKDIQISFTAPDLSSNGGLLLAAKAEKSLDIISGLSRCINDWRKPELIHHTIKDMLSQRVYQIACGYEDADDCDSLRSDSVLKMSCGRTPNGNDLCSQPTMSRLENHIGQEELDEMRKVFVETFIKSYGGNIPAKIILDIDDSNSNTYGCQENTLFNQYYGEYCYMPLFIFEGYSGRMILPILRPGRVSKRVNTYEIVRWLVEHLRKVWPNTAITIRGDAMFCMHQMFEWADTQRNVHFCVGISGNKVLSNHPQVLQLLARAKSDYDSSRTKSRLFGQFVYKAKSWEKVRWIIVKVEYGLQGQNIRFIVVDRTPKNTTESREIYDKLYCKRGDCELWIKDLKKDLRIDRMSCHSFTANQFRVFLYAAAYVLLWYVRNVLLKGTDAEHWTTGTLQLRILKSAAHISEKKTKIKIEFEDDHPDRGLIILALERA